MIGRMWESSSSDSEQELCERGSNTGEKTGDVNVKPIRARIKKLKKKAISLEENFDLSSFMPESAGSGREPFIKLKKDKIPAGILRKIKIQKQKELTSRLQTEREEKRKAQKAIWGEKEITKVKSTAPKKVHEVLSKTSSVLITNVKSTDKFRDNMELVYNERVLYNSDSFDLKNETGKLVVAKHIPRNISSDLEFDVLEHPLMVSKPDIHKLMVYGKTILSNNVVIETKQSIKPSKNVMNKNRRFLSRANFAFDCAGNSIKNDEKMLSKDDLKSENDPPVQGENFLKTNEVKTNVSTKKQNKKLREEVKKSSKNKMESKIENEQKISAPVQVAEILMKESSTQTSTEGVVVETQTDNMQVSSEKCDASTQTCEQVFTKGVEIQTQTDDLPRSTIQMNMEDEIAALRREIKELKAIQAKQETTTTAVLPETPVEQPAKVVKPKPSEKSAKGKKQVGSKEKPKPQQKPVVIPEVEQPVRLITEFADDGNTLLANMETATTPEQRAQVAQNMLVIPKDVLTKAVNQGLRDVRAKIVEGTTFKETLLQNLARSKSSITFSSHQRAAIVKDPLKPKGIFYNDWDKIKNLEPVAQRAKVMKLYQKAFYGLRHKLVERWVSLKVKRENPFLTQAPVLWNVLSNKKIEDIWSKIQEWHKLAREYTCEGVESTWSKLC